MNQKELGRRRTSLLSEFEATQVYKTEFYDN